jgi:hypothetical protein
MKEAPYKKTFDSLVNVFSDNLKYRAGIYKATEAVMPVIKRLPFGDEYKKAIADACIEAASEIDVTKCPQKKDVERSFQVNLNHQFERLFEYSFTTPSPK